MVRAQYLSRDACSVNHLLLHVLPKCTSAIYFAICAVYCVEIILRVIGQGPVDYFGKFWNG